MQFIIIKEKQEKKQKSKGFILKHICWIPGHLPTLNQGMSEYRHK